MRRCPYCATPIRSRLWATLVPFVVGVLCGLAYLWVVFGRLR
jgi:hypothetical protein